jgi:hypothetical protein
VDAKFSVEPAVFIFKIQAENGNNRLRKLLNVAIQKVQSEKIAFLKTEFLY